jgi:hypothetical protein
MARPRASRFADWSDLPHRDDRKKYSVQATGLKAAEIAPPIHEGMDRGAVGPGLLRPGKRTPANEPATQKIA